MSEKLKSPTLIFIVLILISLSLAGGIFYLFQKEHSKNLALQEELEDVRTRQKVTEAKLEESKKTISSLDLKLQEAKSQIDKLNSELQQEKLSRQETAVQLEQVKSDLERQKSFRLDLEKKLTQAQKDSEKTQLQLKDFSSRKEELEKKIADLQAQAQAQVAQEENQEKDVELGKVIINPESTPNVPVPGVPKSSISKQAGKGSIGTLEGQVLVINKDYDFAVINLGNKEGVSMGDIFSVYHGNDYIGDIKVEKVHDSMAAAGFLSGETKNKIREGDRVVRKS